MNRSLFIGNLTKDPELRVSQNKTSICTFTVAVNRRKDRDGVSKADFIPVKCFKGQAESCAKHLKKGSAVLIDGMLQTYSYDGNDGSKRFGFEVVVDGSGEVAFLNRRQNNDVVPVKADDGFTEVDDSELPF